MSGAHGSFTPFMQTAPRATPAPRRSFAMPRRAGRTALLAALAGVHIGGILLLGNSHTTPPTHAAAAPIYATLVQAPAPRPAVQPTPVHPVQPQPQKVVTHRAVVRTHTTERAPAQAEPVPAVVPAPAQQSQPAPSVAQPSAPAAAAPAPAPAMPKTVTRGVQYLRAPVPVYPDASRRMGEEGVAQVRVLVDEAGEPREVELRASSGSAALDRAALDAVRGARFKPYIEDGRAIPVYVIVPLRFSLGD